MEIAMNAAQIFDVRGHVAYVTGAASGIGRAMAEVMADNGAHVVMTDIDGAKLGGVAEALTARGGKVSTEIVDVADLALLRRSILGAAAAHGRLDAVFANAGISAGPGPAVPAGELAQVELTRWERVVHVNLTSVMVTVQAAAEAMKPQRRGRIVVTASIGGLKAEPMVGYAYAATKAGVINLVRQAAIELAPTGVVVNAIAPGPFLTNIGNGRLEDPAVREAFARDVPQRRLAHPDEIKGLALLLASPAASFITGAVIPIDGGATAA
jgi:NAD(P)-dependent dehydrogenase (short-subunit alcohol dehydrogenase family)